MIHTNESVYFRWFLGFGKYRLDAIQNHSAEKLTIPSGNLGELNSHTTGGKRVVSSKAIYPDHFRIDY